MIIHGDCLIEMQRLIDEGVKVDAVVTDPPYHLTSITERFGKEGSAPAQHGTDGAFTRASRGFMGKEWDGGDIAFRAETWALCFELLKAGGHLLAFSGSRTYHRMAVAIEDAGFEIRDQIMWIYGSGFPKSLNIGKKIEGLEGWGTALKPAHEPIVLARKPISEKSIADNVVKHDTGAINIDGCRIETNEQITNHSRSATSSLSKGVYGDSKKQSTHQKDGQELGRFPANVIHDGLQEEWARYFYCPKTSTAEREESVTQHGQDRSNTHPTVKPVELMRYLCRLITPKGGTVLDPFMGSGSTGLAAKAEGLEFIGVERDQEYFDIATDRINKTWVQPNMF
jgi:site-specific DNA-methyltransferase (adenine-specific)